MPLLYEPPNSLSKGVHKVGFAVYHTSENTEATLQKVMARLSRHNWVKHGLELLDAKVTVDANLVSGKLAFKVLPSFVPFLAIAVLIPSILGIVGTIAKLWVVREIANPLLAPGPLGLPMIVWILISAAGVLIPLAIIKWKR